MISFTFSVKLCMVVTSLMIGIDVSVTLISSTQCTNNSSTNSNSSPTSKVRVFHSRYLVKILMKNTLSILKLHSSKKLLLLTVSILTLKLVSVLTNVSLSSTLFLNSCPRSNLVMRSHLISSHPTKWLPISSSNSSKTLNSRIRSSIWMKSRTRSMLKTRVPTRMSSSRKLNT